MEENFFHSLGSSSVKSELQDSVSELSRTSKHLSNISEYFRNNTPLSDLDLQHKKIICYFHPNQINIKVDPQECYEFYYASSTNIQGRFGIIIKNQIKDLVIISQSYPDKTINELEFLATIYGMRYCIDLGIKILNVKGNSQLVTNIRTFKLQSGLAIYRDVIFQYSSFFNRIDFIQIPKEQKNQAKQLSREENDFVKVLINQCKTQDLSISYDQNQSQIPFQRPPSSQIINNLSPILPQKPHLDQIILEYNDIFSEYNKLSIKPINLEKDKDYALIFGKVNDKTNRGANFMINQDLKEIIVGTFYFPQHNNALQEISLLYGMRFLLESKITQLNCFTNDEIFCQLFEKECDKLKQSKIKEQRCLYFMKQLFQKTRCKTIQSTNQLKALMEPYKNKQSRFQIIDESILMQNEQDQKFQSKTFSKFSQIYSFIK